ncbi:surfactin non-ribosomal peptide synthetase SrfAB [Fulvivirga kasyanovii]|uniref:Amino acid adenylation domain-containing protein n=1 Tax=Fulvivirga kasyanovii TaxID=396812 RepID=A0ABW9RLQ8_9BACT|nr:non-ribosomal peptide synthetase [Fulvivirga kasyanovii]MTI25057.1 amino acid adenylation domain-containing protein [Fulvivirga kasyanovii]
MEWLINKLRQHDIDVDVVDDKLKLNIPAGLDISTLEPEIRQNAKQLQSWIKKLKEKEHFKRIHKSPLKDFYALSSAQKRLYFLYEFDKHSLAYNMPQVIKFKGSPDLEKLTNAFNTLIERHEMLRTCFLITNGQPAQKISDFVEVQLEEYESNDTNVPSVVEKFIRPFDLSQVPLIRAGVIIPQQGNRQFVDEHFLLVDMHHIISDGTSQSILIREFEAIFKGESLPEVGVQYKDYAEWQLTNILESNLQKQKDYWLNKFEDRIDQLELPYDFERPKTSVYEGGVVNFEVDEITVKRLRSIVELQGGTTFMVLLSIYYLLLSKLSGQDKIVVGTPVAGRNHAEVKNMIGMFVNTLPLLNHVDGKLTFKQFLTQIRSEIIQCFDNQQYQYEELVEELRLDRKLNRNPLFDVMFVHQNFDEYESNLPGVVSESFTDIPVVSKFDLSLMSAESADRFYLSFVYSKALFKKQKIEKFAQYFSQIVEQIISNPDIKLDAVHLMSEQERNDIIKQTSDNRLRVSCEESITSLIQKQLDQDPNRTALIHDGSCINYGELNKASDQLAYFFNNKGYSKGCRGILSLADPIKTIIGALAILKLGGAYSILDISYPETYVAQILSTCESGFLLADNELTSIYEKHIEIFNINSIEPQEAEYKYFRGQIEPDSVAFIDYVPSDKGHPVPIHYEHQFISNSAKEQAEIFKLGDEEVVVQIFNKPFHSNYDQVWLALLNGLSLVLIEHSILYKGEKESVNFAKYGITHACVTRHEDLPLKELGNLKRLVVNDSSFGHTLIEGLDERTDLFFQYSLPETHIIYISKLDKSETADLYEPTQFYYPGKNDLYILDKNGQLLPKDIVGEVCLCIAGITENFASEFEVNKNRFLQHPYRPGAMLYRTGDLAKWSETGEFILVGQKNGFVKLEGFNFNLTEMGSQLVGEHIDNVVILPHRNKKHYLRAFYTSKEGSNETDIKDHSRSKLPEFMIPQEFVYLEKFELTQNGEIDLALLNKYEVKSEAEKPNLIENKLIEIWSEVFKIEKELIGVNDNFFKLGLHSLLAINFIIRIRKEFNCNISLKVLFEYSSISGLCSFIESNQANNKAGESGEVESVIAKAPAKNHYHLSSAQKRLFFLYELDTTSTAYNVSQFVELKSEIDLERMGKAFQGLINRHEILRTYFDYVDNQIVQKVLPHLDFKLELYNDESISEEQVISNFTRPFKLNQAPLIRVGVINKSSCRDSHSKNILMVDIHHIITDGISQNVLIKEFNALYNGEELAPVKLHYKDYAEWQNQKLQTQSKDKQRQFWLDQYSELPNYLELPTDFDRPAKKNYAGDTINFHLDQVTSSKLKSMAQSAGTTDFMIFLSVFNIFLSKITGQTDIVIGSPVTGRRLAELEDMVGMFVNTLPLRNTVSGEKKFSDFLSQIKSRTLSQFDNQDYQYEELIDELNIVRDTSHNPLFDTLILYQKQEEIESGISAIEGISYPMKRPVSKFDLSFIITELGDQFFLSLEYSTEIFKQETILRFVSYMERIMASILENEEIQISHIDIISLEERKELIFDFNDTLLDIPDQGNLISLFETQVDSKPQNIALTHCKQQISYRELNKKANRLAHYLISNGVVSEDVIALKMDRSIEQMVAVLGILKAGGTYLPIDISHPVERISFMLTETKARLLLTNLAPHNDFNHHINSIDISTIDLESYSSQNPDVVKLSESNAYIIYTSGSTGRPKGVVVKHDSVVNLIFSQIERFGVDQTEKILQFSSMSFDASVEQIWLAFLTGAELVLIDKEVLLDELKFAEYIQENKVTHLHATPSFLEHIKLDKPNNLRRIISGGEECKAKIVNKFCEDYTFYNEYGPTETTVTSFVAPFQEKLPLDSKVCIGKPIANTSAYVLDSDHKLLPKGALGELYISGAGLARGYIGDSELTADRFVNNPFEDGRIMYKTGDLTRWKDGNLEFHGRLDNQVKIRGFRIELGEIEYYLSTYPGISTSVVVSQDISGSKFLVGYYMSSQEHEIHDLKEHLSQNLPDYMIPTYFILINELPLTNSGKVNRKALPLPEVNATKSYVEPATNTEILLVDLWSDILNLDKSGISTNQSFFDLGGHSLKAAVLVNRLKKVLEVEVPLKHVFAYQDVHSLGQYIDNLEKFSYQPIEPAKTKDCYVLSSAQKRMYFLYEFDKSSLLYNMPEVVKLGSSVIVNNLESALSSLISRHEVLRTCFRLLGEAPVQYVQEEVPFELEHYSVDGADISAIAESFIRPFDLHEGPLIRAGLVHQTFEDKEDEYILLFDMHHIISDGVSHDILVRDFLSLYNKKELPAIDLHYKDYAEWQQGEEHQQTLSAHRDFWLELFADELPVLYLPTDFPRPIVKSNEGAYARFSIGAEESRALRSISENTGSTLYMVLLSIYNIFLSKLCGQEDIVIGTPVAGRSHVDVEDMVGMFVNMVVLRNRPEGALSYLNFLSQLRINTLSYFDHQWYQYEDLIDALNIDRNSGRNPLFDVLFSYRSVEDKPLDGTSLSLESVSLEHRISKFDLSLMVTDDGEDLFLGFEYSTDLFTEETIQRFIVYFQGIVTSILSDPNRTLSSISIITDNEKQEILHQFNRPYIHAPSEITVLHMFEEQVEKFSNNIALVYNGTHLRYGDLNRKANSVANNLQEKGIGEGSIVSLMAGQSLEMIIGILGIMKSGAALLPIDPNYPKERVEYILSDSKSRVLLSESGLIEGLNFEGLLLDLHNKDIYNETVQSPILNVTQDHLAYVIYTSGSTGRPKGVMVEHKALTNLCCWHNKFYTVTSEDCSTKYAGIGFDASIWEIFPYLISGSSIHVIDHELRHDVFKLNEYYESHGITISFLPTQVFEEFIKLDNNSLRVLMTGGDRLKQVIEKSYRLVNNYGPTENAVVATCYELNDDILNISIGKPITNVEVLIMDKNNHLQPVGIVGELCVAGSSLARGYINDDKLTEEKFVSHPYKPGERLYRTGDLARWKAGGNLEFIGRIDNQVKIRGFRIELGEIENLLIDHDDIEQGVVTVHEFNGDNLLVAYFVSPRELSDSIIKHYLASRLPDYMIPSHYMQIPSIPLTPNGKVDKRALPIVDIVNEKESIPLTTSLEWALAEIWGEVLKVNVKNIGMDDNFFKLGGHSLKAAVVTSRINKKYNIEMPLKMFFQIPTIRGLRLFIEAFTSTEDGLATVDEEEFEF